MNFHPEKCQVIRICTNKRFRRETTYTLHGHILEAVESAKYLGVTIGEDLQWKTHIDNITAKASRTVGFLRRNLYNCTVTRCFASKDVYPVWSGNLVGLPWWIGDVNTG